MLQVGAGHFFGLETTVLKARRGHKGVLPNALNKLLGTESYSLDFQRIYECNEKCDEKRNSRILKEKFGKTVNGICDPANVKRKPLKCGDEDIWKIPSNDGFRKILGFLEEVRKQDRMPNFCVDRKAKQKETYKRFRF